MKLIGLTLIVSYKTLELLTNTTRISSHRDPNTTNDTPSIKPNNNQTQLGLIIPRKSQNNFTMKPSATSSLIILNVFIILLAFIPFSSSYFLPPSVQGSAMVHQNYTAISSFRVLNRRGLIQCPHPNPYLQINVSSENSLLSDNEYVNVTVSGVFLPSDDDWVAMISPSDSE